MSNKITQQEILDQDNDGFPDNVDSCDFLAETFNGYQDDDGCPDANQLALIENQKESVISEAIETARILDEEYQSQFDLEREPEEKPKFCFLFWCW